MFVSGPMNERKLDMRKRSVSEFFGPCLTWFEFGVAACFALGLRPFSGPKGPGKKWSLLAQRRGATSCAPCWQPLRTACIYYYYYYYYYYYSYYYYSYYYYYYSYY